MAEVTNDLIYEVMNKPQEDVSLVRHDVCGIRLELQSSRGHMLSMPHDIHNIYERQDDHTRRLERIERRLELNESPV